MLSNVKNTNAWAYCNTPSAASPLLRFLVYVIQLARVVRIQLSVTTRTTNPCPQYAPVYTTIKPAIWLLKLHIVPRVLESCTIVTVCYNGFRKVYSDRTLTDCS
jgi:hypothetical protein